MNPVGDLVDFAQAGRLEGSQPNGHPPTPQDAPQQPMRAFPPWSLRIECDRCGKVVMHNLCTDCALTEHQRGMVLRVLLSRMRHDG